MNLNGIQLFRLFSGDRMYPFSNQNQILSLWQMWSIMRR